MNKHLTEYQVNIELSKKLLEDNKSYVEPKMCFNNTFNIVTNYIGKFRDGEWHVAYGFISLSENLLTKHSFILDKNNKVIDVTLANSKIDDCRYFSHTVFDNIDDYVIAINDEDRFPALEKYFFKKEKEIEKELYENNIYIFR